jgi:hypothetical protein
MGAPKFWNTVADQKGGDMTREQRSWPPHCINQALQVGRKRSSAASSASS